MSFVLLILFSSLFNTFTTANSIRNVKNGVLYGCDIICVF